MVQSNSWRAVITALVVAIGLAILWGVTAVWVGSTVAAAWETPRLYEDLTVTARGEVLISSRTGYDWNSVVYRRLDGTSHDDADRTRQLGLANLPSREPPGGVIEFPRPWRERLVAASNAAKPPEAWYLVRDAGPEGAAYFEAFDYKSGQRVGYYGRNGMSQSLPSDAERFRLGKGWIYNRYASSGYIGIARFPSRNYGYGYGGKGIEPWKWFLIDGEDIVCVDAQVRTTEKLLSVPDAVAVSTITVPYGFLPVDGFVSEPGQEIGELTADNPNLRPALATMLAVRGKDHVVIWNPDGASTKKFMLPERLQEIDNMNAYWLGEDAMLIRTSVGEWSGGRVYEMIWINPSGEIQRIEQVELASYRSQSGRQAAWTAAPVAPSPALGAAMTCLVPLFKLQHNEVDSYNAGFERLFYEVWPPLLAVVLFGLVCAAIAWRWHTAAYRSNAWRWAAMVFLVGPAGLLAYRLHWGRVPKSQCVECDKSVPRNRDACPACEAAWPPPALTGVEVYA